MKLFFYKSMATVTEIETTTKRNLKTYVADVEKSLVEALSGKLTEFQTKLHETVTNAIKTTSDHIITTTLKGDAEFDALPELKEVDSNLKQIQLLPGEYWVINPRYDSSNRYWFITVWITNFCRLFNSHDTMLPPSIPMSWTLYKILMSNGVKWDIAHVKKLLEAYTSDRRSYGVSEKMKEKVKQHIISEFEDVKNALDTREAILEKNETIYAEKLQALSDSLTLLEEEKCEFEKEKTAYYAVRKSDEALKIERQHLETLRRALSDQAKRQKKQAEELEKERKRLEELEETLETEHVINNMLE